MAVDDQRIDEPVEVVAADQRWAGMFAAERDRIKAVVGDDIRIEHFGSTAVPGLAAKPIVDILVGVPPGVELVFVARPLELLGYECPGEAGVPGRVYLRRRDPLAFNVSVTTAGGALWKENLALRLPG